MAAMYELTYNDNTVSSGGTPEKGRCQFRITTINAGNLAAVQAALATLLAAIQAMVIGELNRERIVLSDTLASSAPATSPLAQRENKWLVRYQDTVTHRIFKTELPTADLSLLAGNSEFLNLAADEGAAFKSAFEAIAATVDGNPCTVISVQFVGRSS